MKPIIFMFSGQGSQYYQMGKTLFQQNQIFKIEMLKADAICQDLIGTSVIGHIYADYHSMSEPFSSTVLTHPAIFMIEHALSRVLLAQGIEPTIVLGSSLGEFAASVVAGIMSFETAMVAVITQAQVIESYCQPGSMLAVLGQPVNIYYENPLLYQNSELAATNFDGSFVIAGAAENLQVVEQFLQMKEIIFQRIAVSHAFHSSLIDPAAQCYLDYISKQRLQPPAMPFISSVYIETLNSIPLRHYWDIVRLPIKFQTIIEMLEEKDNYYYIDVGPSGTLATFVKYNLAKNPASTSKSFSLLTPFNHNLESQNLDNLKSLLINNLNKG